MDVAEGGVGVGVEEVCSSFDFLDFGPGRYFCASDLGVGATHELRGSKRSEMPAKGSPPSLAT